MVGGKFNGVVLRTTYLVSMVPCSKRSRQWRCLQCCCILLFPQMLSGIIERDSLNEFICTLTSTLRSVSCSWSRHLTLTLFLPTKKYKWVQANCWRNLKCFWGSNLRWTGIVSRGRFLSLLSNENTPLPCTFPKEIWLSWLQAIGRLYCHLH